MGRMPAAPRRAVSALVVLGLLAVPALARPAAADSLQAPTPNHRSALSLSKGAAADAPTTAPNHRSALSLSKGAVPDAPDHRSALSLSKGAPTSAPPLAEPFRAGSRRSTC